MILRFSKALSPHSLELITQANIIIKKLNGIVSDIQSTQNLEAENHNIQDEILPLIKDQQYRFSKRITELEAKKKTILASSFLLVNFFDAQPSSCCYSSPFTLCQQKKRKVNLTQFIFYYTLILKCTLKDCTTPISREAPRSF